MLGSKHQQVERAAWTDPEAYATSLFLLFCDRYRGEATDATDPAAREKDPLYWDPRTIYMEIEQDVGIALPPANFDRLMVAIAIHTTDLFYSSLPDFLHFCTVLGGAAWDPRVFDPADVDEVAWGMTEGMLLYPPEEGEDNPFCQQITAYVGAVLDAAGIIHPPDILRIATDRESPGSMPDSYTDDPAMFAALSSVQERTSSGITDMLRDNMQRLAAQIESLPLREGDTKGAVQRVFGQFAKH